MLKDAREPTLDDVLQPGKNMLAAGYCMYGSSCTVYMKYYPFSACVNEFNSLFHKTEHFVSFIALLFQMFCLGMKVSFRTLFLGAYRLDLH